jgi:hypothetical protein
VKINKKFKVIGAAVVYAGVILLSVDDGKSSALGNATDPLVHGSKKNPHTNEYPLPFTLAEPAGQDDERLFLDIRRLCVDHTVMLPLSGGRRLKGNINYVSSSADEKASASGSLADGSGIFEITYDSCRFGGFVLQKKEGIAYLYSSDGAGGLRVARRPISEMSRRGEPDRHKQAVMVF